MREAPILRDKLAEPSQYTPGLCWQFQSYRRFELSVAPLLLVLAHVLGPTSKGDVCAEPEHGPGPPESQSPSRFPDCQSASPLQCSSGNHGTDERLRNALPALSLARQHCWILSE